TEATPGMPAHPGNTSRLGCYFAAADYNGDGIVDLAVGADGKTIGSVPLAGAVYVFAGTNSGLTTVGSQILSFASPGGRGDPQTDANLGDALSAGDFNHDGKVDLVVAADWRPLAGRTATKDGMILILPGSATSLVSSNNGNYQAFAENSKGIP